MIDIERFTPVRRLVRMSFRSPDPAGLRAFYRRHMGLPDDGPDGLRAGPAPCALRFVPGAARTLESVTYEVDDPEEVARRAERAGVPCQRLAEGLSLTDLDGNRLLLVAAGGAPDPVPLATPEPYLQHLTYGTPDCEAFAAWYRDVLGFRVSDWQERNFVWLRCGSAHHVVAAVRAPAPGLDHFAFELAGWEEIKRWADQLCLRGIRLAWGPGRHGAGNNLFLFFLDADGNRIELSAELEQFFDGRVRYEPRHWPDGRWTANQWGPQPDWR